MLYRISGGDKGDFQQGKLAWDILRMVGSHRHAPPNLIDLSGCVHLKAYSLACIAAVGAASNGNVHLVLPDHVNCREHCLRHGVHRWFKIAQQPIVPSRPTCVPIEQRFVSDGPGNFAHSAMQVWVEELGYQLPVGLQPELENHLDEMILNALGHSGSSVGCFVIGQGHPGNGIVEVCVLDFGVTIKGHLTKSPKYSMFADDEQAIVKALELGVTGTPIGQLNLLGEPNSGVGLANLFEFCELGHCEISIMSGGCCVCFARGGTRSRLNLRRPFPGTLVDIKFHSRQQLQHMNVPNIL